MNSRPLAYCKEFAAPTDPAFVSPIVGVDSVLAQLRQLLLSRQRADGSWCGMPVRDGTLEAELLIVLAFLKREGDPRIPRLILALLDRQLPDGGWTSALDGRSDVDATALACLALTLMGTGANSEALDRGRSRLAGWGTAGGCSGSTRLLLALFGLVPHADDWRTLPAYSSVEDWALKVIDVYRPIRQIPRDLSLAGLFRDEFRLPGGPVLNPLRRWNARQAARELQRSFIEVGDIALNGPTSVWPAIALGCLGLPDDSSIWQAVWRGFDERTRNVDGRDWIAPFLSPLRDTAHALVALRSSGSAVDAAPVVAASEWLFNRLMRGQARGDMAITDAALSLIALAATEYAFQGGRHALIGQVVHAILDEQHDDGGWGPADVTGLVLEALAEFGFAASEPLVDDAIRYLERSQSSEGAWAGSLGVNQLFGTSRALSGLWAVGVDPNSATMRKAVGWLQHMQHIGGGWGEAEIAGVNNFDEPNAVQTAWALTGLIAAGENMSPAIEAGVEWLLTNRGREGVWNDDAFTGRDPRGPHRHPLHQLFYALTALAQVERRFGKWAV